MTEKSYHFSLLFTVCVVIAPRNLSCLSSPSRSRHCMLWRKIKLLQHKSWLQLVVVSCSSSRLRLAREGLCKATKFGEPKWDSVGIGISGLGGQTLSSKRGIPKEQRKVPPKCEMQKRCCVEKKICSFLSLKSCL